MISQTVFEPQINSAANLQFKTSSEPSEFNEILTEKSTSNFDRLKSWAKGIWSKTTVNVIDASKIEGRYRKDFPQALYFKEGMTLDELNKNSPKYPELDDPYDPRALKAGWAACEQNGIAFLISPVAVEKMNSDEEFYRRVMAQLEEKILPSIQESMTGLPRIRTNGDFTITSTDCSIIVEIDDNGCVNGEVISTGYSSRTAEDDEPAAEKKYIRKKSIGEDTEVLRPARNVPAAEKLSVDTPRFEYLYSFLGSFNTAASETLLEHRRR